tara:strand:- start:175 stop:696 length:522 start_codon:yes stop_codon:yes gene_type:complete
LINYFLIILVVFFDQSSKFLVKSNLYLYQSIDVLNSFLRFTFIENSGIAFGIDTSRYHLFITCLTIITIVLLFYYLKNIKIENSHEKIPISLVLGGAIGNAIDRVLVLIPESGYSGVIDFIDMPNLLYFIGIMDNPRWFIFNIADCSITIGLVLYFILQYVNDKKNEKSERIS